MTAFWRARRSADGGPAALLAHFEFALWRRQTWAVLTVLGERPALTAAGRRLVEGLRAALAPWLDEPVPQPAARLAELSAVHHRGVWRSYHVRPDKEAVRAVAAALATGGALPDADVPALPDGTVEPDPRGCPAPPPPTSPWSPGTGAGPRPVRRRPGPPRRMGRSRPGPARARHPARSAARGATRVRPRGGRRAGRPVRRARPGTRLT
ncbi:hypothetical protein ACWD5R_11225 [Streptomyces sp. NPDC002514]|uniref:hypothetical protein n=1 Tax=Streptomyces sp. NPDC001270 TaxID=3364554 RepID=UPI0036C6B7FC